MVILMGWKVILAAFSAFIIVILVMTYYFIPLNTTELKPALSSNSNNFTINDSPGNMQFYNNMRFPKTSISYTIENTCSLSKRADMEEAFLMVGDLTVLDFYRVDSGGEISVSCEDKNRVEGGLFIAGEGGPTNITVAGDYNIITSGKILLIRDSQCPRPNVALHELFHVLGFDHSSNPDNIMYEVTKCSQTISEDMITFINNIYSVPSKSDLIIENITGIMHGRYLNANMTIRNQGFADSGPGSVVVYADDKVVKDIELEPLEIGYGTRLSLYNIWVSKLSVNKIRFVVENDFEELTKENNEAVLSF
jgi:hypothetical protein